MGSNLDSLKYLCVCMDEIPSDFQPLDTSRFGGETTIGIKEIFLYLANINNTDRLISLLSAIKNLNFGTDINDSAIASVQTALKAIIDERYINIFVSYIFSEKLVEGVEDNEDIFTAIETACMVADKFAELLCNPKECKPSGLENRDIITAMIGTFDDGGIAFKTRYHPIMGYCGDTFTYFDSLAFTNLLSIVNMAALTILKSGVVVRKCCNCGDYFIPSSRSDEIYCDRLFENGKTCKTVGYDKKVKRNDILREYRKIYKTQHARKQRNQHRKNISQKFQEWTAFAKEKVSKCELGEISIDEMVSSISSIQWME